MLARQGCVLAAAALYRQGCDNSKQLLVKLLKTVHERSVLPKYLLTCQNIRVNNSELYTLHVFSDPSCYHGLSATLEQGRKGGSVLEPTARTARHDELRGKDRRGGRVSSQRYLGSLSPQMAS